MPGISRTVLRLAAAAGVTIAAAASAAEDADITVAPASEPKGATVERAVITSGVADREPRDELSEVDTQTRRIFFFTEIRDGKGQEVIHRWRYDGEVLATVDFDVEGDRWRVWSSKQLRPDWTGEWRVEVVTADGRVLERAGFDYVPAEGDQPGEPGSGSQQENPLGPGEAPDDTGQPGQLRIPGE